MHFEASIAHPVYINRQARSARKAAAIALTMETVCEVEMDGKRCVQGLVTALVLEAAALLSAYALWLGWHLIR
jgi:hypothetical protein